MSIGVKICKYVDLGQKHKKSRFWSKFSKISILVKIVEKSQIWSKFVEQSRFWTKLSKIIDFVQNLQKKSILAKKENGYFSLNY